MTPIKEYFDRRRSGERKNGRNRPHATPSPEQQTTSLNEKSPRLGTFSWASRGARDLTGGASPGQSEAKTILEVGDLIKCRTASPVYTLQRLDALESLLKTNDLHRGNLLETAKLAVQVAYSDFDRARQAARQRMSGKEPPLMIHLADISDLRTYVETAEVLTEELETGMLYSGALRHLGAHYRYVAEALKVVLQSVARGGADAEMTELRWTVERKCMYCDAVAMLNARIGEANYVGGVVQRLSRDFCGMLLLEVFERRVVHFQTSRWRYHRRPTDRM
jgi:hypothetical protein